MNTYFCPTALHSRFYEQKLYEAGCTQCSHWVQPYFILILSYIPTQKLLDPFFLWVSFVQDLAANIG